LESCKSVTALTQVWRYFFKNSGLNNIKKKLLQEFFSIKKRDELPKEFVLFYPYPPFALSDLSKKKHPLKDAVFNTI